MKKLQVFVSSTIYDLEKERAKVVEAILDSGHIPVGMELLGGANTITSTIKKMIEGYSKPRNPAIARAFSYMKIIEKYKPIAYIMQISPCKYK